MDFITINDSIDILRLSVRSTNALKHASIQTVGDLLDYPVDELYKINNMGAKSVTEVATMIESLKRATNEDFRLMTVAHTSGNDLDVKPTVRDNHTAEDIQETLGEHVDYWLREILKAKQEHDSDSDSVYLFWIYKSPVIRSAVKAAILKAIDSVSDCHLSDVDSVVPSTINGKILNEILTEMETEQLIAIRGNDISRMYQTLLSFVNTIPKERTKDILLARLTGLTLDEIGQRYDLTRERVRQIVDKELNKKPRLAEDKYVYLYENYDFSKEDFNLAFGERDYVFYYLETVAALTRGKRKPIIEILTDGNVPVYLRKRAEKAIYKEYVTINGVRIRKQRQEIVEYVIRTKCRNLTKFGDFVRLYKEQLQELGLSDDPAFVLDEGTYTNKLPESNYVLWSQWQNFRYYFIPERDYEPLLSGLNLKQYQDTEFSTLKLFRDYPELMREYDIRDEYELHNLLKKIWAKEDTEVIFKKMPTITVGNPDRDTQILDLLLEYAPISVDDLASKYEETYGAKAATVKGSYFSNFSEYYYGGIYSIQADNLPQGQFAYMKAALNQNFYTISQVKEIYKKHFPDSDESQINPYTLKTLGFRVMSGYVVSDRYASARDYFTELIETKDAFTLNELPDGVTSYTMFTEVLYDLKAKRQIVEYLPRSYFNKRVLDRLEITEDAIKKYCDAVRDFAEGKAFFTIASLREDSFNHKIGNVPPFDDWFFASLLTEERDVFSYKRIGQTKIFVNGIKDVSFAEMLTWIIRQHKKMTITALNNHLEKRYGIILPKDKLITLIHETGLYYDQIMKEVYESYDDYRAE